MENPTKNVTDLERLFGKRSLLDLATAPVLVERPAFIGPQPSPEPFQICGFCHETFISTFVCNGVCCGCFSKAYR